MNEFMIKRLPYYSLGIEKGGSTIRTYRNTLGEDRTMQDYLRVTEDRQPCPRCASTIEKIRLVKRNAFVSSLSKTMIIGLTGGIASGKSTVVEMIKEVGYKVIDADQLVHDMQGNGQVVSSLA